MIVRKTFPQVYRHIHKKTGKAYYLVSARKHGFNDRKTFGNEKEALDYARQIEENFLANGKPVELPKEKMAQATAYEKLVERLAPFSKTPEEAVSHYVKFLGEEIIRQAKPTVGQLVDKYQAHKLLEKRDDQ